MKTLSPTRQRSCQICKAKFKPERSFQRVCGVTCAIAKARQNKEKAEKAKLRKRKAGLKTVSDHLRECQVVFNRYIRLRDAHLPCVSCQRHHQGQYHAGHYRSVGACGALRFNELNVHKQCAPCNNHKSGNIGEYRTELVKRIGEDMVKWLEAQNAPADWDIEEIIKLKAHYKKLIKDRMIMDDAVANPPF